MKSSQQKGIQFEQWITKLYNELGKLNVKHNITKKKSTKHGKTRSQIDVRYGLINKKYIECKYHDNQQKVTFNDVTKFAGVLKINNINYAQGIIITNTSYETRAQAYAQQIGLKLVDRQELVKLDWKRSHQLKAMIAKPPRKFSDNLETRIKAYKK